MGRKIVLSTATARNILVETRADNEAELQELIKDNPDLLPVEEFDMTGPVLVVGRETALQSGAVDLVAIARSEELLIVEFKTGPQNTDFRRSLAQLLDYGSDVWGMTFDDFEATVVGRYFAGDRFGDQRLKGTKSIIQAAREVWPGIRDDEVDTIGQRLREQLEDGSMHYVLIARRFTDTILKTAEYLNRVMAGPRVYAVEVVRFDGDGMSAFEARTILKPSVRSKSAGERLNEDRFLDGVADSDYRAFLQDLLDTCRGLGYRLRWGTAGVSVRLPIPGQAAPLSVIWIVPRGTGWKGLRHVSLGYAQWSVDDDVGIKPVLNKYVESVARLRGAEGVERSGFEGTLFMLSPNDAISHAATLKEILAELINSASAGTEG